MKNKMNSVTSTLFQADSWVAIDCETTGFPPRGRLIELGAIHFNRNQDILSEFHELVRPPHRIPKFIVRLTGLNDELLKESPVAHDVINRFLEWLPTDVPLIAHNVWFDIHTLAAELPGIDQTLLSHPIIDSLELARSLSEFPNCRLATVASQLKSTFPSQCHRVRADVRIVKDLFFYAVAKGHYSI